MRVVRPPWRWRREVLVGALSACTAYLNASAKSSLEDGAETCALLILSFWALLPLFILRGGESIKDGLELPPLPLSCWPMSMGRGIASGLKVPSTDAICCTLEFGVNSGGTESRGTSTAVSKLRVSDKLSGLIRAPSGYGDAKPKSVVARGVTGGCPRAGPCALTAPPPQLKPLLSSLLPSRLRVSDRNGEGSGC